MFSHVHLCSVIRPCEPPNSCGYLGIHLIPRTISFQSILLSTFVTYCILNTCFLALLKPVLSCIGGQLAILLVYTSSSWHSISTAILHACSTNNPLTHHNKYGWRVVLLLTVGYTALEKLLKSMKSELNSYFMNETVVPTSAQHQGLMGSVVNKIS